MNRTTRLGGLLIIVGLVGAQACSDDASTAPTTTGIPDAGATNDDAGATNTQDGGGSTEAGADAGACSFVPGDETFGLADATKLAPIVKAQPSSLPANARANTGRFLVDECGVRALAELDGTYSIHTAGADGVFTATSTASIEGIASIGAFRAVGTDLVVLATTHDNKSYLHRMPRDGGPLTKVVSDPLINGDFGAQSIAVSATHVFFNNYKAGPTYELRRASIASLNGGTIALEEPLGTDSGDNARGSAFLWGDLVAYGFKHYKQDCTPQAGAGCTAEEVSGAPNLRYVFAGQKDALYAWAEGKLTVRTRAANANVEGVPNGVTTTLDESFVAGSVSPDGTRVAIVTRSSAQGFRLLRISDATGNAPTATALPIAGTDNVQDVWTNGKVVLVMWAQSADTKPLALQGVAWP